jgi:acyl carrier protein
MSQRTLEQVLADLEGILRNFGGREYSGKITPQTMFSRDLGMASIDALVLGETIEEHYHQKLPFGHFLAELGKQGARDIEIGVLAEFLKKHLKDDNQ